MLKNRRMPDGPTISSSNISSSNSLEGHLDFIEKLQLCTLKASIDKGRHKIGITLPEKRGIREALW